MHHVNVVPFFPVNKWFKKKKNIKLKENICLTTMIFIKFAILIYLVTMTE